MASPRGSVGSVLPSQAWWASRVPVIKLTGRSPSAGSSLWKMKEELPLSQIFVKMSHLRMTLCWQETSVVSQQEGMACPKVTPVVPLLCGGIQQRQIQDCEVCQAPCTRLWRDADEQGKELQESLLA